MARSCPDHQSVSVNWCAAGGPTDHGESPALDSRTDRRTDGRSEVRRTACYYARALTAGLYATSFRPSINQARQAIPTSWFTSCRPRRRRQLTCICRRRCNPRRWKLNVEEPAARRLLQSDARLYLTSDGGNGNSAVYKPSSMLCILLRFSLMYGAQSLSVVDEGNVLGALEGTRSAPLILYDHGAIQIYLLTYLLTKPQHLASVNRQICVL